MRAECAETVEDGTWRGARRAAPVASAVWAAAHFTYASQRALERRRVRRRDSTVESVECPCTPGNIVTLIECPWERYKTNIRSGTPSPRPLTSCASPSAAFRTARLPLPSWLQQQACVQSCIVLQSYVADRLAGSCSPTTRRRHT